MTLRPTHFVSAALLLSASACAVDGDEHEVAHDNDPVLARRAELFEGAPKSDSLPREWKADDLVPTSFDIRDTQSSVKNQARRGVCSIFSAIGLMEHLYMAAGAGEQDFSEQFLQWSTKVELGEFTFTSGSSSSTNLRAINLIGVPDESAWPYEPEQWNELNDPACVGEDPLPVRCYTNGDPSDAALAAERSFLPVGRFLSWRDVKNHIFGRQQAVVADLDFFYQAWNHRKSTLPTNPANWNDGIVLYPNDEDQTVSLEERAGHSIVLIGWDDDMEVPVRDADGNTVTDANGNVVVEKGFYLFKNSWGTAGFGIENPFGAGYGWISQRYVSEFGSIRISDLPVLN